MAFLRQEGFVKPAELAQVSVAIIGAGSIGSFTALALTKMGVKKLTLVDKDNVELHNVSNQFFIRDDLGKAKVDATMTECLRHSPEKDLDVLVRNEFYDGSQQLDADIVIVLTDNIEGRAAAFKAASESFATKFFIDGRMGGELFRLFAFDPHDLKLAEKYREEFLDGVANSEEPCTARTIIYNVLLASSFISSYVKKYTCREKIPFQLAYAFGDMIQVKSKEE